MEVVVEDPNEEESSQHRPVFSGVKLILTSGALLVSFAESESAEEGEDISCKFSVTVLIVLLVDS